MSYPINKTNGELLTTLLDGTINSDTGLTLVGRNYVNYGELQNENFVRLLENFADNVPPGVSVGFAPIAGQLWWDTGTKKLKIFDGTNFVTVSERTSGNTAPDTPKVGDQWWDSVNQQLLSWSGSAWQLVGPAYTVAQGKSGPVVESIIDTLNMTHVVVSTYSNGNLINIASFDPTFIPATTIPGITAIQPGVNQVGVNRFVGTTVNAEQLGNLFANVYARTDITTTFNQNLNVSGNLVLGSADLSFNVKNILLQNKNISGNINLSVTTGGGLVNALTVDGNTGLITVVANPATNLGIATKGYVDVAVNQVNANVINVQTGLTNSIDNLRVEYLYSLNANVVSINANVSALDARLTNEINTLANTIDSEFIQVYANIANKTTRISSIESALPSFAPLASPALTGIPTAPTPAPNNNSTTIATTAYVDAAATALTNDYVSQIAAESASATVRINNLGAIKANINSPVLTGTPQSTNPTALTWNKNNSVITGGDSSTRVATTQFVNQSIAGQKFNYTVSSSEPSGGNDGDFWFQVG